jgi:transposase
MSVASSSESIKTYGELLCQNAIQAERILELEQKNSLIEFKLKQLTEYVYGRRSEKQVISSPNQETLFDSSTPQNPAACEEEYIDVAAHKKKRPSKKKVPEDLPVDEVVYEPTETHCGDCGEELHELSRDIREETEFRPARFFKRQHVTVNCVCPKCKDEVYRGKTPPEAKPVIPGAAVGPGFLAHVMVSKFVDHLPYYRQSKIYEREGVFFPDKTLSRYGMAVGALLEPVAKQIKKAILATEYLQGDETHIDVLDKDKSPNTHTGQLWVLNAPLDNLTYYEYNKSRSKEAANSLLSDFSQTLQTDAYAAYGDHSGIHIGCMAHARRYFVKAREAAKKESQHVIRLIAQLYKIEKELTLLKTKLKPPDWHKKRVEQRTLKALPVLEELKSYLQKIRDTWVVEEHPLVKAVNYMLSRYEMFTLYATDGRFEIDNNAVERAIRPCAIGRRNWLFAGSHNGAKMAAIHLTVLENCKKRKINPQEYLTDVLPRLADQNTKSLDGITPLDWIK